MRELAVNDIYLYRVWPDYTVQLVADGRPYEWMSDDFVTLWATDEEDAIRRYNQYGLN